MVHKKENAKITSFRSMNMKNLNLKEISLQEQASNLSNISSNIIEIPYEICDEVQYTEKVERWIVLPEITNVFIENNQVKVEFTPMKIDPKNEIDEYIQTFNKDDVIKYCLRETEYTIFYKCIDCYDYKTIKFMSSVYNSESKIERVLDVMPSLNDLYSTITVFVHCEILMFDISNLDSNVFKFNYNGNPNQEKYYFPNLINYDLFCSSNKITNLDDAWFVKNTIDIIGVYVNLKEERKINIEYKPIKISIPNASDDYLAYCIGDYDIEVVYYSDGFNNIKKKTYTKKVINDSIIKPIYNQSIDEFTLDDIEILKYYTVEVYIYIKNFKVRMVSSNNIRFIYYGYNDNKFTEEKKMYLHSESLPTLYGAGCGLSITNKDNYYDTPNKLFSYGVIENFRISSVDLDFFPVVTLSWNVSPLKLNTTSYNDNCIKDYLIKNNVENNIVSYTIGWTTFTYNGESKQEFTIYKRAFYPVEHKLNLKSGLFYMIYVIFNGTRLEILYP